MEQQRTYGQCRNCQAYAETPGQTCRSCGEREVSLYRIPRLAPLALQGAPLHEVARRAYLTTTAAVLALGAAVVALVVPVESGGIDYTAGVVLLLVLALPCWLYVPRLFCLRWGLLRSARRFAIAAIIACLIWAVLMLVVSGLNESSFNPSPDERATTAACFYSDLLYWASFVVGCIAVTRDFAVRSHLERELEVLLPTAAGILLVALCLGIVRTAGPNLDLTTAGPNPDLTTAGPNPDLTTTGSNPEMTRVEFDTVFTDPRGNLYGATSMTLEALSPRSAILARTSVHVPFGFTGDNALTVDAHRHVIVYAAERNAGFFPPEKLTVYSWTGRLLHSMDLKPSLACDEGPAAVTLSVDSHNAIFLKCSDHILKLSPDLTHIEHWGHYRFGYAPGLGIDGRDNLYLLDGRRPHVVKFSPAGRVLARWKVDLPSPPDGQDSEASIVTAPNGRVVVGDQAGDYRAFSSAGRPLGPWRQAQGTPSVWSFLAMDARGVLYAWDGFRYWKEYPNGHEQPWRGPQA